MIQCLKMLYNYLKFKCDVFLYSFKEPTRYKVNMIAQIIFGLSFLGIGIFAAYRWVYDMGTYPPSLTNKTESVWYDDNTDSLLTIKDDTFTFISLNNDVDVKGTFDESYLVFEFDDNDTINVSYLINKKGNCTFTYNNVEYAVHYCNPDLGLDVASKFDSRKHKKEQNTQKE